MHNDDEDDDNDYDEDNTARLDRRHSLNENIQALERVKSLTQRNRMALDKLSTYSRGTPSPKPQGTARNRPSFSSDHLSGSETERESLHPPNSHSTSSQGSARVRLLSAPPSPGKALSASTSSPRSKKRVSLATDDVTHLALAAVASSRRSPTGAAKKRSPLPKEFRDSSTASSSSGNSTSRRGSVDGQLESNGRDRTSLQLSPRSSLRTTITPGKSSTVRDLTRKHQTRWLSEDMSSTSSTHDDDVPIPGSRAGTGRRQSLRGGSAESALTVGPVRTLVGEGLRAAGLNRRSRELPSDVFDSSPLLIDERSSSRLGRHPSASETRSRTATLTQRSKTSLALVTDPGDDPESVKGLRSYKSAYPLPREREPDRAPSSLSRYNSPLPDRDRERFASPYGRRPPSSAAESEHTRLMHDSLSMFESHLSRLPVVSPQNDLLKSAETLVHTAERLNVLLRLNTNKALEEQIEAEVNGSPEYDSEIVSDIWRKIGGEYREGLRQSDELVRSVTSFLLGFGTVVREVSGTDHTRTVSLNDADYLGMAPTGRKSVERRSWEARVESALGVRPPSSALREREKGATPPPPVLKPSARNSLPNGASSMRRLYSPRELAHADSQDTILAEPSPTPASRAKPRPQESRTLPSLSIPKPLPTLPSETPARRGSVSADKPGTASTKRKSSVSTMRGPNMAMTTPTTTTALTPHTVSNSPVEAGSSRLTFPSKTNGTKSPNGIGTRNTVTFSRSSTVSALQHLSDQRKRTISNALSSAEETPPPSATITLPKQSEAEKERRARVSLGGGGGRDVHPADRSAAVSVFNNGPRTTRERRRTVVDIWPPSSGS